MSNHDDVRWFRSRLVAASIGSLDDADEARFEALRAGNAECAAIHTAFVQRRPDAIESEHLPPDLIARWKQVKGTLKGAERDAIFAHLDACDDCREDLSLLGYETTPETSASRASERGPNVVHVIRETISSAQMWWQRLATGWAIAATAAAIAIAMQIGPFERAGAPDRPLTDELPVRESPPPVVTPHPEPRTSLSTARSLRIQDTRRDASAAKDTLEFSIRPESRSMAIDIAQLVVPIDGANRVEVVLVDPRGRESRVESDSESLQRERVWVDNWGEPVEPGVYRLDVIEHDPSGSTTRTFWIRVQHTGE